MAPTDGATVVVQGTRQRNRQLELDWLRRAVVKDPTGLIARAIARIDRTGQRSYGDTWAARPIGELVAEIREECADIPGWSVLTAQRLDELTDSDVAARIDAHLAAVVEYAGRADAELHAVARLLVDAENARLG